MWARRSLLCSETHTGTWSSPRMSVPPIISGTTRGSFLCSVCWVCFLCKSGTRVQLCPHHRHPPGRSWNLLPTLQPPEPASAPPAFSHPGLADPPLLSRAARITPRSVACGLGTRRDTQSVSAPPERTGCLPPLCTLAGLASFLLPRVGCPEEEEDLTAS